MARTPDSILREVLTARAQSTEAVPPEKPWTSCAPPSSSRPGAPSEPHVVQMWTPRDPCTEQGTGRR